MDEIMRSDVRRKCEHDYEPETRMVQIGSGMLQFRECRKCGAAVIISNEKQRVETR